jgi:hypothetical protein
MYVLVSHDWNHLWLGLSEDNTLDFHLLGRRSPTIGDKQKSSALEMICCAQFCRSQGPEIVDLERNRSSYSLIQSICFRMIGPSSQCRTRRPIRFHLSVTADRLNGKGAVSSIRAGHLMTQGPDFLSLLFISILGLQLADFLRKICDLDREMASPESHVEVHDESTNVNSPVSSTVWHECQFMSIIACLPSKRIIWRFTV